MSGSAPVAVAVAVVMVEFEVEGWVLSEVAMIEGAQAGN